MSTARPPSQKTSTLHAIALLEGAKGMAAIAASVGLLSLAHHDVRAMAYALIGHFHLDPDAHYPRMLLDGATLLANEKYSSSCAVGMVLRLHQIVGGLWLVERPRLG
jgi:uncharacterized membrane protein (DUF2068 family)